MKEALESAETATLKLLESLQPHLTERTTSACSYAGRGGSVQPRGTGCRVGSAAGALSSPQIASATIAANPTALIAAPTIRLVG